MFKKKKIINWISCVIGVALFTFCYFSYHYSYASTTGIVSIITNQDVIEKEEEIEVIVNLENVKTVAFDFSLYFDDSKLEYLGGPENTNIIGNRIIFVWYDTNGGSGAVGGELAKFKFKAKEGGLATFSMQGEFYSQVGQLIQTDFRAKQIQIGQEQTILEKQAEEEQGTSIEKNNVTLQVLRLNREGIIPNFNPNIHEYYLTVSNDIQNIEVLAISENPNATIEITGNTNLQEGLNPVSVRVTSEDKTQSNVYTIQVTKTTDMELANTNLEILAIENILLNPPFDTNGTNYKAEVSNTTENINLLAIPENEQATVEISGKENLKEGNNLVTVIVTAPNGFTKKKYQVEVYRRNEEEERAYQEELERQKEMLEQAYKIQELSSNTDESQESSLIEESKEIKNIVIATIILLAGILLFVIVFWFIKRKKM